MRCIFPCPHEYEYILQESHFIESKRIIAQIEPDMACRGKNWKRKARKEPQSSDASSATDEAGNESEPFSGNISQLASPESGICDACWKLL
jgi:hypothetical protein